MWFSGSQVRHGPHFLSSLILNGESRGSEVEDAGELERIALKGRAVGEFFEELNSEVQSLFGKRELRGGADGVDGVAVGGEGGCDGGAGVGGGLSRLVSGEAELEA